MSRHIFIACSEDLQKHVVIDVTPPGKTVQEAVENIRSELGFTDLTLVYAAFFMGRKYTGRANMIGFDAGMRDLLSPVMGETEVGFMDSKLGKFPKIGNNIYRLSIEDAVRIVARSHLSNMTLSPEPHLRKIVESIFAEFEAVDAPRRNKAQERRQIITMRFQVMKQQWAAFVRECEPRIMDFINSTPPPKLPREQDHLGSKFMKLLGQDQHRVIRDEYRKRHDAHIDTCEKYFLSFLAQAKERNLPTTIVAPCAQDCGSELMYEPWFTDRLRDLREGQGVLSKVQECD